MAIKAREGNTIEQTPGRKNRIGQRRCERIKTVAANLFLAHGFDGVSLDDVILQAGGSKRNIYDNFGSKEGLFLTVVEGLVDEFTAPVRGIDLVPYPLEEGLRIFARTVLDALLSGRPYQLYRLVVGESGRFPDVGRRWFSHGPQAAQSVLADFLSRHSAAGAIGMLEPDRAAAHFHHMLVYDHFFAFGLGVPAMERDTDRVIDEVVRLFCLGYLKR